MAGWSYVEKETRRCMPMGTYLVVETIEHIPGLECEHEPHGIGNLVKPATTHSLFANHADVNEHPEHEAGTKLVEGLDIKGANGRVQLATNVELDRLDGQ